MNEPIALPDAFAFQDLVTYLERADWVERASARLVAQGGVLAVYTAALHPAGLMDSTPTVLGLRTVEVDPDLELDVVVPIRSLQARLATVAELGLGEDDPHYFELPAAVHTVTWAGVAPPRGGWRRAGDVPTATLAEAARAGIAEVAAAVPQSAGEHIVRQVRETVWGRPLELPEILLPAGAAFAADRLGFLGEDPVVPLFEAAPWLRLSTPRGHVLVRRRGAIRVATAAAAAAG